MDRLWLGYSGLNVPYGEVVAILFYRSALDPQIVRTYGSVPIGVCSVVVTACGQYLPARWHTEQLRQRWTRWRLGQDE